MTQLTQQPFETSTVSKTGKKTHSARVAVIAVVVLLLAGGFAIVRRLSEHQALAKETEKLAVPTVALTKPGTEPADESMVLPGQLQAFVQSAIYSRTNGYLLNWTHDIGSHVQKGQLLAEIDTPEVDQELSQAKAARQQIEAQLQLAKSSAERWTNLRKTDSVSQQEADQQTSAYTQAQANLAAADANVRRLEQLESFKHIYAPFSGVITRRNVDRGALITAGSTGQRELFDIAQVDPLRVYVNVPQSDAPSIKTGLSAFVELQEFPNQKFPGKVVRTADAIDPATRTLLTEIDVPNKGGHLLPGSYAQVSFAVPLHSTRITVPVNTLLFRAEGPRVAVVGSDQKVHLKPVTIGRDFGTKLEILGGLDQNDQIVVNPADSLEEGQRVNVKAGGDTRS